jgi:hypothetical protein
MLSDERYVPLAEVSAFLGVDYKTAKRWLVEHGVKHVVIPCGTKHTTIVWKPDFDRFLREHTVSAEVPVRRKAGRPSKLKVASNE